MSKLTINQITCIVTVEADKSNIPRRQEKIMQRITTSEEDIDIKGILI